ncbi:DUF2231 domain-containing protein [Actinoallomurus rhizosphaericola]|uniref:DUF2231 domain-containing protein n=1 Tax=Actinoallomurus rhizosphaericola TaxID=2952536 RepID=UPI002091C348|nr:DUF2231 domain-containing protein [Actinoallomurus rhizosphaericola]MCO5993149.1 hypothetical protein [Actinoallomurus rhizosphaericola]
MFSTIMGLPAHPLVIHAVVVLIPLAALGAIVVAVWPAARERYASLALGVATVALLSVPLATHTGELLEEHVKRTALVERHTEMADGLLPFAGLLWLGLAVLVFMRWYSARRTVQWGRYLTVAAAVVAVVGAVASGVQVVRIGHSGASAAWHGVATSSEDSAGRHH